MAEEIVRVMRLIIYEGPRSWVEKTISTSIKGTKLIPRNPKEHIKITAVTLNEFPEIIKQHEQDENNIVQSHI